MLRFFSAHRQGLATIAASGLMAFLLLLPIAFYMKKCLASIEVKQQEALDEIREARFNDMVDRVTENASTDRERVLALASHVCATVRNDCGNARPSYPTAEPATIKDPLEAWDYRRGVCGWRSHILIRALARLNIEAHIFNIYDYDFGHSCVLATYNGRTHFIDPTYGGYFSSPEGRVLSWEEISADPEAAARNMVVFPKTLDCYADGSRAVNKERMADVYAPAKIAAVENAGVYRSRIFVLPVVLARGDADGPLVLGRMNGSEDDMRDTDVAARTRCWYLDLLGSARENFAYRFRLEGLSDTSPVTVTFRFCGENRGKARFLAESGAGKILAGAEGPVCSRASIWRVEYQPEKATGNEFTVRLSEYPAPVADVPLRRAVKGGEVDGGEKSYARLDCLSVEYGP